MFEFKLPFSTSIDYEGQRKSEKIFQVIISVFAAIGFIYGFYVQKFSYTLLVLGVGVALTAILILPPWPFWNRHPIKWQKVVEDTSATTNTTQSTSSSSSSEQQKESNRKKK